MTCQCEACVPQGNGISMPMRFIVCQVCGNKRCPHAADHRNACTNSNEVGQKGSSWEDVRSTPQQYYIYHYHGFSHEAGGATHHIDGILRMVSEVRTMDEYRLAKDLICEGQSDDFRKNFVVTSLSLLSKDFE